MTSQTQLECDQCGLKQTEWDLPLIADVICPRHYLDDDSCDGIIRSRCGADMGDGFFCVLWAGHECGCCGHQRQICQQCEHFKAIVLPHARSQANADGFQAGWHGALTRVSQGDSLNELRELVPSPPQAGSVSVPASAEPVLERAGAERKDHSDTSPLIPETAGTAPGIDQPQEARWRCACGRLNRMSVMFCRCAAFRNESSEIVTVIPVEIAAPPLPVTGASEIPRHGVDCPKVNHWAKGGWLHAADDDGPYDIDGVTYCGRCHAWIETAPVSAQAPAADCGAPAPSSSSSPGLAPAVEDLKARLLSQAFVAGQMDAQLKGCDELTKPALALLKEKTYRLAVQTADDLILAVQQSCAGPQEE